MNAIRHGVASRHTLMPGEDPDAYATLLAGYFESLGPRNAAEAAVVSELADLGFRLRRLTMTTDGIMLRRLDEHIEQTRLYRVRHKTGNCLIVVRATASVVEEVAPKDSVAEMAIFLDGLDQLIAMLDDLEDLAPVHVAALEAAKEAWMCHHRS